MNAGSCKHPISLIVFTFVCPSPARVRCLRQRPRPSPIFLALRLLP